MSKSLFITGTGTEVGKTYVTGLILKKLREGGAHPAYYKAAVSGNRRRPDGTLIPGDALQVQQMAGLSQPLEAMCPYVYEHAYSPHLAARLEGNPVELDTVIAGFQALSPAHDFITVEGSGGILCPIRMDGTRLWLEDIIRALGLSAVLVADAGLGTINSVALTAEYMRAHNLPLKGVIFNHCHPGHEMEEDNIAMCERVTGLPTLAKIQTGDTELPMDLDALTALYDEVKEP